MEVKAIQAQITIAMLRLLFWVALCAGDHYSGLHKICNIYRLDKVTKEELFKKTDGMNMSLTTKNRRL